MKVWVMEVEYSGGVWAIYKVYSSLELADFGKEKLLNEKRTDIENIFISSYVVVEEEQKW